MFNDVYLTAEELEEIRKAEEAAKLAAYYSKGRDQEKVEIDYVEKKAVKKVPYPWSQN